MADENSIEEDFDKPDPATKLDNKVDKDDAFKEESDDADDLDDIDVEIEGDKKVAADETKHKSHSEEGRFGKRRFRPKNPSAREVRDLENKLNSERARGDRLEQRLDAVEKNTSDISSSTIDADISEAQRYYDQAKHAHAQAVKDGDGDSATNAIDIMNEARDTLNALKSKKNVKRERADSDESAGGRKDLPKPDPVVMRQFNSWHAENDWYDPGLRDKHSRIAFHIDNAMAAEGYDPRTKEYYEELSDRLRSNKVLATEVFNDEADDDSNEDEMPRKTNGQRSTNGKKSAPINERSSQNGGRQKIVVSRERAEAMRQMGLQPGTEEWKKMAKKYSSWDKQHNVSA